MEPSESTLQVVTVAVQIRAVTPEEDPLIAQHFYQMWRDLDVPSHAIHPDWLHRALQFIDQARRELSYTAFVAEIEGQVVGSASCQIFAGLYPNILTANHRLYGYIWGVYVEAAYRRRGIATRLTEQAIAHLRSLGCTHAVLNASPMGKSIYTQLGFLDGNAMRLDL
jgi:ribosomal protein S18 acetylase RimI-like enzyme